MMFSDFGLAAPILRALQSEGYDTPTPIQAKAIPIVLTGRDVLGIAQTGTGKTAAFALPIIHRLASDHRQAMRKSCRVLVLSPTRELATQIAKSFRTYGRHLGITVTVVFGGVGHRPQSQAMARGVDVLVATPGRLIDHLAERNVVLSGTEVLVLDEADQMLDLGFLPPIRRIVSHLRAKRQNLFFSATMPSEIGKLADELLCDPARISAARTGTTVASVKQRVIHVESHNKRALLVELFGDPQMARALVFTRTKRGTDRVARHLESAGIRVAAIHGDKSQSQREHALASFRASRIRALVATDIAARGIDVELVTHVVNFELPEVPENYVHRIGRTARAGAAGVAISLCDGEERDLLRNIERLTRQPISAEDRRVKGDPTSDRPVQRERNGRVGDDRRAHASGMQRDAPRNDHRHGQRGGDTGHYSSAGGRTSAGHGRTRQT
jgi:ATP-dependent RNA helicase RhlE